MSLSVCVVKPILCCLSVQPGDAGSSTAGRGLAASRLRGPPEPCPAGPTAGAPGVEPRPAWLRGARPLRLLPPLNKEPQPRRGPRRAQDLAGAAAPRCSWGGSAEPGSQRGCGPPGSPGPGALPAPAAGAGAHQRHAGHLGSSTAPAAGLAAATYVCVCVPVPGSSTSIFWES